MDEIVRGTFRLVYSTGQAARQSKRAASQTIILLLIIILVATKQGRRVAMAGRDHGTLDASTRTSVDSDLSAAAVDR